MDSYRLLAKFKAREPTTVVFSHSKFLDLPLQGSRTDKMENFCGNSHKLGTK